MPRICRDLRFENGSGGAIQPTGCFAADSLQAAVSAFALSHRLSETAAR